MSSSTLLEKLRHWNQVVDRFPDLPLGWYERGGVWLDLNRYEEALADYTNALRLDPGFTECRYCRALALGNMGREDDAYEDYSQVIEDDPRHVSAYNNRGIILMNRGKLKEALRDFTAASEIDPAHPRSRYNQGLVMGSLGRYQEAAEVFTAALGLNPQYTRAYIMRAKAYQHLRELDRAEDDLSKAAELGAGGADFHALRARQFLLRGLGTEAAAEMRLAFELDPDSPELQSLVEEIESMSAEPEQAVEPEKEGNAPQLFYPQEAEYRELLRPASESGSIRALLCAFLLAEDPKDLAHAVKNHPLLVTEEALDFLEHIGEKSLPIRAKVRRHVSTLRSVIADSARDGE